MQLTSPVSGRSRAVSQLEEQTAKLRRQLAGDLDEIVLMALRKEPQRRYGSVEQFAEDIRRHLEGLPVSARRDSWRYRATKFASRHKLAVAAAGLVLTAVLGGVTATVREARIAAANGHRAEQRFNDVRKLASSLMFEIHDSIEGLPGATPARKLIVQRSLEYLDNLSREDAGDVSLQRELANAYERIGRVQGDPEGSNLGEIQGAVASFGKALNIREKIGTPPSEINLPDQVALAASYREMCRVNARYLGSIKTALAYCGKALSVTERLRGQHSDMSSLTRELAKDYEALGRVYGENSTYGNAGDSYAALENHRKALALLDELVKTSSEDMELRSWRGKLIFLVADDLFETGQATEALPLYQQATQTFEALTKESNNPNYEDSLLFGYQRTGDMLLTDGHFEQSVAFYQKELDAAQRLVAEDPKNMVFRIDLAASRATLGHGLWRAGHVRESLASLRLGLTELADTQLQDSRTRGLETTLKLWLAGALEKRADFNGALRNYLVVRDSYRAICQSDPTDVEDCLNLAGTQERIGRIYLRRGEIAEALAEDQNALAVSERLSNGDRPNLEALYTVVSIYFGLGEVHKALAYQPGAHKEAQRKQACGWYEKSSTANQRIPNWRPVTPGEFDSLEPRLIGARLSQCRGPRAGL
ncbi:MAG TPA: tetratricopeptide repeat protein [Candidatus Sulfotelmatobacter sp.]|nr:tetratricopeptide repeat protein [Candidatus Sulfotelmatobacter sp.]